MSSLSKFLPLLSFNQSYLFSIICFYGYEKILKIPEIVECHHVTGNYSLLVKIYAKTNEHLKDIIVKQIQSIVEITSTETIISLQEGFTRQLPIE